MHQPHAQKIVTEFGVDAILETLAPFVSEARSERIDDILAARLTSVGIVLENLYDSHNGAAAIRSVEAFGLTGLDVVETEHQFSSASGVTMGCDKWITLRRHPTMAACANTLRGRGFTVYATLPGAKQSILDIDVSSPVALVFGNEHAGLTPEAVEACDAGVSIPMYGFTQSFNLSVSVALSVQELAKRRRDHLQRAGDLNDQERARLRAEWYVQSVKAAAQILDRECVKLDTGSVAAETQPQQDR